MEKKIMTNLNLNYNEGVKTFSINGDESRVISVNLTDFGILNRFEEASKKIKAYIDNFDSSEIGNENEEDKELYLLKNSDRFVREQIDYIFNSPVSDIAFGKTNCLSLVQGEPLYYRFFEVIIPEIRNALKDEKRKQNEKTQKYQNAAKYKKNNNHKKKNYKGGNKK